MTSITPVRTRAEQPTDDPMSDPTAAFTCDPDDPGSEERCRRFRSVASRFATGVTVTTTHDGDQHLGLTVNSFTTVSLDPTMLLVCLAGGSQVAAAAERSGVFAVTVLADDQGDTAQWFADRRRYARPDQFDDLPHQDEPRTGCRVLTDGLAWFACRTEQITDAGDHVILLGRVGSSGVLRDAAPLVFFDGHLGGVPAA